MITVKKYRVCGDLGCESVTAVTTDIENALGLDNVRIDPETGDLTYDNPQNCHVDEHKLEEAARKPGRDIQFEICE